MRFENWTRKLSGLVLVCALAMWCLAGVVLATTRNSVGEIYISDIALLGAYFTTIIGVILPVIVSGGKSVIEKNVAKKNGNPQ